MSIPYLDILRLLLYSSEQNSNSMDWVNAWRFSACSAQLVQGWKQGHLSPALALSLVAISVIMWGKPSCGWSQQAATMWKWGVRERETERDAEGEREWPCWAPLISLCLMYIPGFPSSESQGEINSPLVNTWGPGLTGPKSRIDPHIKQGHSSKKYHTVYSKYSNHAAFSGNHTHHWSTSILELASQAHHIWPIGRILSQSLVSPR